MHWSVFFTWWMIAGAVLYGLVWWRVLTAGAKAWFAGMVPLPLVFYWVMPLIVVAMPDGSLDEFWGLRGIGTVVIMACLMTLVGLAPMQVFWRAQDRARKKAKRDRAQAAEQVIRRLGA